MIFDFNLITMNSQLLRDRSKKFAIDVIKFVDTLPKKESSRIVGRQLLRSATSTAANYRATCRARSKAEFFAKLSIVVEEADESLFWMEVIEEADILRNEQSSLIKNEALELLKIFSSSRKSAKKNR